MKLDNGTAFGYCSLPGVGVGCMVKLMVHTLRRNATRRTLLREQILIDNAPTHLGCGVPGYDGGTKVGLVFRRVGPAYSVHSSYRTWIVAQLKNWTSAELSSRKPEKWGQG